MRRHWWIVGVATLAVSAPAAAVPPTLVTASHQDRRPTATFAAPSADAVYVDIAKSPDVATNGEFFTENSVRFVGMTATEIQSGYWLSATRLDPGDYWMMIKAFPSFSACWSDVLGDYRAECANGLSGIVSFRVPKPKVRYRTASKVFSGLGEVDLTLTAAPMGERRGYRVCWVNRFRVAKCRTGELPGFSWESPAQDTIEVPVANLRRVTQFTWRVAGRVVARRAVRVR
jgi:hypothetical protein